MRRMGISAMPFLFASAVLLGGGCIRRPAPVVGPNPVAQTSSALLTVLPFERHQSVEIHNGLLQRFLKAMNVDLVYGITHHLYEKGSDNIWDWPPCLSAPPSRHFAGAGSAMSLSE